MMTVKVILAFTLLAIVSGENWMLRKLLAQGRCGWWRPDCGHGKVCVGTLWRERCMLPVRAGQRGCGIDPYHVCEEGTTCENHVCVIVAKIGHSCKAAGHICEYGSRCNGRICIKLVRLNQPCGNKGLVCNKGLRCRGITTKKCVMAH